ncbi:MAG: RNA polymerase sigma factor (sigma-70 family), partial [Verrucomicrobiales bacterium]
MGDFDTRQTLLIKIRDRADQRAWEEFVDLYTPLVIRYSASRGVPDSDRADVVQEIFKAIARAMERFDYDRDRAKFRTWLFTVCRSKINNYHRSKQRRPQPAAFEDPDHSIEDQVDPREEKDWEGDYRRHMFQWAVGIVRPEFSPNQWAAFWETALNERKAEELTEELGMSKGAIYVAKSRVIARLRERVASVAGDSDIG